MICAESQYGYDPAGNRITVSRDGTTSVATYGPGDRLLSMDAPGEADDESYGYDLGGRQTTLGRHGRSWTLDYTSRDQVREIRTSAGAVVQQATYDGQGRRVAVTTPHRGERRFVVAPAPATSLESPYLVTDDRGEVLASYVYGPSGPLLRIDGDGEVRYLLEDGLGSTIAQVDATGTVRARFGYDAFGNDLPSLTSGSDPVANHIGGDYRWKQSWTDTATGFVHLRARDYNPVTGRFVSRDPMEGIQNVPETYQPYAFAFSNPMSFSDPTGEFTIVELNISMNMQSTLQNINTASRHAVAQGIKNQIGEQIYNIMWQGLKGFVPGIDWIEEMAVSGKRRAAGNVADFGIKLGMAAAAVQSNMDQMMWIEPVLDPRSGKATVNGSQPAEFLGMRPVLIEGTSRPDFIFSRVTPKQASRNAGKSFIIGDVKLSGDTLYNTYVVNKKTNQLDAILNYAKKYTSTNVAFFLTVFPGQRENYDKVKKLVMNRGFSKGVIFVVLSAGK